MNPVTKRALGPASYVRLRSGAWGARVGVPPVPEPGAELAVVTRAGATRKERVRAVVWACEDFALCSLQRPTLSALLRRARAVFVEVHAALDAEMWGDVFAPVSDEERLGPSVRSGGVSL
jgi:hypothetical protein